MELLSNQLQNQSLNEILKTKNEIAAIYDEPKMKYWKLDYNYCLVYCRIKTWWKTENGIATKLNEKPGLKMKLQLIYHKN